MIEIQELTYSYPKSTFHLAIDNLAVQQGEKIAIIGPSGFGKTTLLNLVAGILLPQKGNLSVGGKEVSRMTDQERRNFRISTIGFVFQDFKLVEYLNVRDNILFPFRLNRNLQLTSEDKGRAEELAGSLNIGDKIAKFPGKLSHGERQRVAICRALVNNPSIILADEPTGNLDPDNKEHILEILFDYSSRNQASLLVVTHDHSLLKGFDRIIDFAQIRKKHEA